MIASAVAIPEEPQRRSSSPVAANGSLKRRQSSVSNASESSKKPRLDHAHGTHAGSPDRADRRPSTHEAPMSPPRRKPSAIEQDKSRSRRLFGALLGPAGPARTSRAASNSDAPSRREEIHARQADRLRRDSEQLKAETARKREQLDRVRRTEQLRWDEEAMRRRHENMRATAKFLRTATEPRVYYRPWDLRREDEDRLDAQRKEVEEQIERERRDWDEKKGAVRRRVLQEDRNGDAVPDVDGDEDMADANGAPSERSGALGGDAANGTRDGRRERPRSSSSRLDEASAADPGAQQAPESDRGTAKDDEHNGEELEQGNEDDVIY